MALPDMALLDMALPDMALHNRLVARLAVRGAPDMAPQLPKPLRLLPPTRDVWLR